MMTRATHFICSLCLYLTSFSIIPAPAFAITQSEVDNLCNRAARETDRVRKDMYTRRCTEARKQLNDEKIRAAEAAVPKPNTPTNPSTGNQPEPAQNNSAAQSPANSSPDSLILIDQGVDPSQASDAGGSPGKVGGNGSFKKYEQASLMIKSVVFLAAIAVSIFFMIMCFGDEKKTEYYFGVADVVLFFVSSIAFIVAEVINWTKYKTATGKQTKIYKGDDKDKQAQSYLRAYEQTKAAAKSAEGRSLSTKVAVSGFYASAALALVSFGVSQIGGNEGFDDCSHRPPPAVAGRRIRPEDHSLDGTPVEPSPPREGPSPPREGPREGPSPPPEAGSESDDYWHPPMVDPYNRDMSDDEQAAIAAAKAAHEDPNMQLTQEHMDALAIAREDHVYEREKYGRAEAAARRDHEEMGAIEQARNSHDAAKKTVEGPAPSLPPKFNSGQAPGPPPGTQEAKDQEQAATDAARTRHAIEAYEAAKAKTDAVTDEGPDTVEAAMKEARRRHKNPEQAAKEDEDRKQREAEAREEEQRAAQAAVDAVAKEAQHEMERKSRTNPKPEPTPTPTPKTSPPPRRGGGGVHSTGPGGTPLNRWEKMEIDLTKTVNPTQKNNELFEIYVNHKLALKNGDKKQACQYKNKLNRYKINTIKSLFNMLWREAFADGPDATNILVGLGIGAAIGALIYKFREDFEKWWEYNGLNHNGALRSLVYLVFAGLGTVAFKLTDKAASELNSRARAYRKLYEDLKKKSAGAKQVAPETRRRLDLIYASSGPGGSNPYTAFPVEKKHCAKEDQGQYSFVDCKECKTGDQCSPPVVVLAKDEYGKYAVIDPVVANTTSGMNQYAQAVFSQNSTAQGTIANQMAGGLGALRNVVRTLQEDANARREKVGKAPFNFPAALSSVNRAIGTFLGRAFASLSGSDQNKLAKTLNGGGGSSEAERPKVTYDRGQPGQASTTSRRRRVDVKRPDAKRGEDGLANGAATLTDEDMNRARKFKRRDIHQDPELDLFKIIHGRYIKSLPLLGK